MTTRAQIIEVAKSYVGVRWRHEGRTRNGMDCVGLLVAVSQDLGLPVIDYSGYKRIPDGNQFRSAIIDQTDPGAINCIQSGSIIMMKQAYFPCHCGIGVMDGGEAMMVHASAANRLVSLERLTKFYRDIITVREFKGVE